MPIATHIIKVAGAFDKNAWKDKKELREYVDNKIKNEIDPTWFPDLELFKVDDNKIEVWVYISAPSLISTKDIIERWIKNHIKEKGISVDHIECEDIRGREFLILIS